MFPGDCTFLPYLGPDAAANASAEKKSPTNGRIFELKFSSSSQRHYFWLQSKSQHSEGNPSIFSKRDLLLGEIVSKVLDDDEASVARELALLRTGGGDDHPSRDDDAMEDVQGGEQQDSSRSGGAGPHATGGDRTEQEGQGRRGGENGGSA